MIEEIKSRARKNGGLYVEIPEADGSAEIWVGEDGSFKGEGYAEGLKDLESLDMSWLGALLDLSQESADLQEAPQKTKVSNLKI